MNLGILDVIESIKQKRARSEKEETEVPPPRVAPPAENAKAPRNTVGGKRKRAASSGEPGAAPKEGSKYQNSGLVVSRLREMGEPVRLFAESDLERIKRLKIAELHLHEKKTSSKGIANVFKDMQEKVEIAMEDERARGAGQSPGAEPPPLSESVAAAGGHTLSKAREDFSCAEDFVLHLFKRLLADWGRELERRPAAEKRAPGGKNATAIHLQTLEYLRPLFAQLEERGCAADVLQPVERIVQLMRQREYLRANNEYLTMSIGNAPWPMGLTMVSIHERKGRSKIYSNQIAHILNDEETRKYIQSIKRLLTFCQRRYPPRSADKKF